MEVSHASADRVTGLTNVSFGGTLQVIVNGTLNGGEIFKLFEAQSYSGDFTVYDLPPLSDPLSWNTNSLPLDGTLKVAGGIVPLSFNPEVQRDGASLIFRGSGGKSPGSYCILSSTNLNLPLTNWTRVTTNQFDSNGSFIFTNIVKPAVPAEFFQIQLP